MEIIIVVVFDNDEAIFFSERNQFHSSRRAQRNSCRIMMMWCDENDPDFFLLTNSFDLIHINSFIIYSHADEFSTCKHERAIGVVVIRICYDHIISWRKQNLREHENRHLASARNENVIRGGLHSAGSIQFVRQNFSQLMVADLIA